MGEGLRRRRQRRRRAGNRLMWGLENVFNLDIIESELREGSMHAVRQVCKEKSVNRCMRVNGEIKPK